MLMLSCERPQCYYRIFVEWRVLSTLLIIPRAQGKFHLPFCPFYLKLKLAFYVLGKRKTEQPLVVVAFLIKGKQLPDRPFALSFAIVTTMFCLKDWRLLSRANSKELLQLPILVFWLKLLLIWWTQHLLNLSLNWKNPSWLKTPTRKSTSYQTLKWSN